MTVEQLEREFPLYQKWAVEVFEEVETENGTEQVCSETLYYETGKVGRCKYYKHHVQIVRGIRSVIYIRVYKNEGDN